MSIFLHVFCFSLLEVPLEVGDVPISPSTGTFDSRLDVIPKLPSMNASFVSYSLHYLVWTYLFCTHCSQRVSASSPCLTALCSSASREGKSWGEFGLRLPTHPCSLSPPWGCARGESCCATACDPSPEIVLAGSGTRQGSWCCSAFTSCRPHGGTAPFLSSETRPVLTHKLQSPVEPFPGFW